jgi:hypothetical protein
MAGCLSRVAATTLPNNFLFFRFFLTAHNLIFMGSTTVI